jgi:hypothetical protein
MICRKCAEKPATYHVSEIDAEGIHRELRLCLDCARDNGFLGVLTPSAKWFLEKLGAEPNDPGYTVLPAAIFSCQLCSKGHASIHLFEAAAGYSRERHLCEECGRGAAQALDSVFTDFPDEPVTSADPRTVFPECGRIRFDFGQVGVQVRANIQFAMLPVRILVRGCAWRAP